MSSSSPCLRAERSPFAFTLVEVMVSMAILTLLVSMLATILAQSSRVWQKGIDNSRQQQRARAALEFMSRDLRQAALPLDRTRQNSLRFEVNPAFAAAISANHPNSLFWQAPIATETSRGPFAAVGYFVRWENGKPGLYRLLLNPSDPQYDPADPNAAASQITDWTNFLFLENVVGIWVEAYDKNALALASPFDSRAAHALPAAVAISLVLLEDAQARNLNSAPNYTSDAAQFVAALPASLRASASIVSIKVNLDNANGW